MTSSLRILFGIALSIVIFSTSPALALCSNNEDGQPGQEGEIEYFSSANMLRYCDDTNWIDMIDPTSASLLTGLAGHWKLNDNTNDASGNNPSGTLVGDAAYVTGVRNSAIELDGTGDSVNLGSAAVLDNLSLISACAWISPDVLSGYQGILGKSTNGYNGWDFYAAPGGNFGFYSPEAGYVETTGGGIPVSTWTHVCASWDGTDGAGGITLYLNGSTYSGGTGTGDLGGTLDDSSQNLSIGLSAAEFDGKIDDARLYNRVLSGTEIANIFNNALNRGLVGYWKLDETTGTTAFDSSGNGHNALMLGSLNGSTNSVAGKVGNAINFDESNSDTINIPDTGMPTGTSPAFSMGAWVKVQENSPQTAARWSMGYGDTSDGSNDAQIILNRDANNISYQVGTTAQGVSVANYLNKWMHIFLTFDGTNARLYQNGIQLRTDTVTTFNPVSSNGAIGGRLGGGADFNGDFDEVRMYDRALSASEVETLSICTGPGTYAYNFADDVMQFCDDVNSANNMHTPASGSGGCTSPTASEGALDYDTATNTYRACDGSGWITIE